MSSPNPLSPTVRPFPKIAGSGPSSPSKPRMPEHRLTVKEVLDDLVADGWVAKADADLALAGSKLERGELHPLVVIANKKLHQLQPPHQILSLEALTEWLANKVGLPYLRIDPLKLDIAAVERLLPFISFEYAARYQILPVAADDARVVFATTEPWLSDWQTVLGQTLRRNIERVIANPLDVNRYQMEFYGVSRSVRGALKGTAEPASGILNFEQLLELGRRGELSADERPIVQIVDWLLQYAFSQRASDIHLEPRREQGNIRFRIDGVLNAIYQLPPAVMSAVTSRIKILGRMDVAEKRRPQDGRIKTRTPAGREIELRLSTMPTAFGEKCVLRIFDPDTVTKSFGQLGFAPAEEAAWKEMIARPHGIVLVTGPTGSGKTTTLYTTLKQLASPEVNVCTVEDPIEMISPELNQMQVQPGIELTFAHGIRTLLRQDPDIIMVGEIRDLETAEIAIKAAQTGHMVLSTLHTNSAPQTLSRLMNMGVAPYNIASSVTLIIAQRLARRLCQHCKEEIKIPPEELTNQGFREDELPELIIFKAVGCDQCNHGYKGRVGVYEVLPISEEIGRIIMESGNALQIAEQARKEGINDLRRSGLNKVRMGLTSLEEINRVTTD